MNPVDWAIATEYADLVAIAESVDPADSYDAPVIAKIATAGYTFLHAIYGNELATDINPHMGQVVTFGFLALSPAKCTISRLGTG